MIRKLFIKDDEGKTAAPWIDPLFGILSPGSSYRIPRPRTISMAIPIFCVENYLGGYLYEIGLVRV